MCITKFIETNLLIFGHSIIPTLLSLLTLYKQAELSILLAHIVTIAPFFRLPYIRTDYMYKYTHTVGIIKLS